MGQPRSITPQPRPTTASSDRAARLAALTSAHHQAGSAGGSSQAQSPVRLHPPSSSRPRYRSAAEEKRQLEAELVSDAVCASLRAVDPEEWRAKAEASWRAQAGTVPTPAKVRKGERLMLEAQVRALSPARRLSHPLTRARRSSPPRPKNGVCAPRRRGSATCSRRTTTRCAR